MRKWDKTNVALAVMPVGATMTTVKKTTNTTAIETVVLLIVLVVQRE